jgi:peptidyl-prolyl cis-trans isomerase C
MTMGFVRWAAPLILTGGGLLLASCDQAPSGQVVAKVNGEEITQQQLDAALTQFGAAPGLDPKTVRKAMLEQVIERRLVVAKARQLDLDKTPEYLTQSQALEDKLLISLWQERLAKSVRTPLQPEVDEFIRANPGRFAQRQVFTVDQIRTTAAVLGSDWLPRQTSLSGVAEQLKLLRIPFASSETTLDSSDMDPTLYDKLAHRDPSRPFAVPFNNDAIINVITSTQSKPLDFEESRKVAAGILRRRNIEAALKHAVAEYRQSARVVLPAAPTPSASPAK